MSSVDSMSVNSFSTSDAESFSSWFMVGHTANTQPLPRSMRLTWGSTSHGSPTSISATSAPDTGSSGAAAALLLLPPCASPVTSSSFMSRL